MSVSADSGQRATTSSRAEHLSSSDGLKAGESMGERRRWRRKAGEAGVDGESSALGRGSVDATSFIENGDI